MNLSSTEVPSELTFQASYLKNPTFALRRLSADPDLLSRRTAGSGSPRSYRHNRSPHHLTPLASRKDLHSSAAASRHQLHRGSPVLSQVFKSKATRGPGSPLFKSDFYIPVEGENITYKAEERLAEWKEHQKTGEVRQAMGLLLYEQILKETDDRVSLAKAFADNKTLLGKMLLRCKDFQLLLAEMTHRASEIMRKEFTHNQEQIGTYLNHPRPNQPSLKIVPPAPVKQPQPVPFKKRDPRELKLIASGRRASVILNSKEPSYEMKQMKKRLSEIDSLVDNLEDDQDFLDNEMEEFEEQAGKKEGLKPFQKVGKGVASKLEEIAVASSQIQFNISDFLKQGQKDHKTFEQRLAHQRLEAEVELRRTKHAYLRQIDWIKRKTAFRITALELALVEVKLLRKREQEWRTMEQEDKRSQEVNEVWNGTNSFEDVKTVEIARKRLMRFDKQIKTLRKKVKVLTSELDKHSLRTAQLYEQIAEMNITKGQMEEKINEFRAALIRVLGSSVLYKNSAQQEHVVQMLESGASGDQAALQCLEENESDNVVDHLRRDATVLRSKMKEIATRLYKYKVLGKKPLRRKDMDRAVVLNPELRNFLQDVFGNQRIRQILALKENELAVGLLESGEEPAIFEVSDQSEASPEERISIKRTTSRKFGGLKSRKISGLSQLSSSIRSPRTPASNAEAGSLSPFSRSRTAMLAYNKQSSTIQPKGLPLLEAPAVAQKFQSVVSHQNEKNSSSQPQIFVSSREGPFIAESIKTPIFLSSCAQEIFSKIGLNFTKKEKKQMESIELRQALQPLHSVLNRAKKPLFSAAPYCIKIENGVLGLNCSKLMASLTPEKLESVIQMLLYINGISALPKASADEPECSKSEKTETTMGKLLREITKVGPTKKIRIEDMLEKTIQLPDEIQKQKLQSFLLPVIKAIKAIMRSGDAQKAKKLLNLGSYFQQPASPAKPTVRPLKGVKLRSPQNEESVEQKRQALAARKKEREQEKKAKVEMVKDIKQKLRKDMKSPANRATPRKPQVDIQTVLNQEKAVVDPSQLEQWIKSETKKTISALEQYIQLNNETPTEDTRFSKRLQSFQSDDPSEFLSASTSPHSQIYIQKTGFRGKALRVIPRQYKTARKLRHFPVRRSSLVEKSLGDQEWRRGLQSPLSLDRQNQSSQDYLTASSLEPYGFEMLEDFQIGGSMPRSTFANKRAAVNLSLTLPRWEQSHGISKEGSATSSRFL